MVDRRRQIGPYRVLRPLGQGGMGIVYEAFDVRSAARVALKVVRVGDGATVGSIRREIAALATLRHPGIVRIVDQGLVDGLPWYAMELQRGTTLADHVVGLMSGDVPSRPSDGSDATEQLSGADAWLGGGQAPGDVVPGPKPEAAGGALVAVLTLLSRLCAPIGYLHGEGLVHRDLKPSNVVVRPDGTPIVIDFGIAGAGGGAREVLDVDAPVVGTAAYMAPEQVRGDPPDARADLYAFGCIAYELVTGRTPFRGESDASILHQKLQGAPEAPSSLATGVPPGLDALILSLLAGDPRDRPGYADDVARELKGLGAGDLTYQAVRARPHVYRPSLHGRAAVMACLDARIGALRDGRGSMVVLEGESGLGKTRVAMEAAARAAAQGILVLAGSCDRDGASPLGGFRGAIGSVRERCRNSDDADRFLGRRGKILAAVDPALRDLPGQSRYPDPPELPEAAGKQRVLAALWDTFVALGQPVLLVIDDAQWADPLTADALNYLERVREHEPRALLFVLTMRPDEAPEPLLALSRRPGVERLALGALADDDIGDVAREMLALPRVPGDLARFLARRSAGNPFFAGEYVRAALALGVLYRDADGHWQAGAESDVAATEETFESLPVPVEIEGLLARRLHALSPSSRAVAGASSVLGREVDPSIVARVMEADDLLQEWAELCARGVMEECRGGFRFVEERLVGLAYAALDPTLRRAHHRRAAEAIVASGRPGTAAELGRQWEGCGERARAGSCYLEAARHARSRYSLAESARLYAVYLASAEALTRDAVVARIELGYGVLSTLGELAEAEEQCLRACADAARMRGEAPRAEDLELEGRALGALGTVVSTTGRLGEARDLMERALGVLSSTPPSATALRVHVDLGNVLQSLGMAELARERYAHALTLAEHLGDRATEGRIFANLGNVEQNQGRVDRAASLFERAIEIHREMGERRLLAYALGSLGALHASQGRSDDARRLYEDAVGTFRDVGDLWAEGAVLLNLGNLCRDLGVIGAATEHHERALAIMRRIGDRRCEGAAVGNLASGRLDEGRVDEAREMFDEALRLARETGDRRFEGIWLRDLAGVLLLAGDVEAASDLAGAAMRVLEEIEEPLHVGLTACVRGEIALERGQDARDHAGTARAIAARIGAGPGSGLGSSISRLERAIEARARGERIVRGACRTDHSAAVLAWLSTHHRGAEGGGAK